MSDVLVETGVGSTDWTGGVAPAGGVHTGISRITMNDGSSWTVAHSVAEARQKTDAHAVAPTIPAWVAFDQPGSPLPVILDVSQIAPAGIQATL